jgi:hypothetical protein
MKLLRAIGAQKWQLSLAKGFALHRERYLEIDTIPKPCGLGFGSAQSVRSVRLMSGFCPELVRPMSGDC